MKADEVSFFYHESRSARSDLLVNGALDHMGLAARGTGSTIS